MDSYCPVCIHNFIQINGHISDKEDKDTEGGMGIPYGGADMDGEGNDNEPSKA